jgi:hypothetical protein
VFILTIILSQPIQTNNKKTQIQQIKHCYHISVPHFVARFAALFDFCGAMGGELWSSHDGCWW